MRECKVAWNRTADQKFWKKKAYEEYLAYKAYYKACKAEEDHEEFFPVIKNTEPKPRRPRGRPRKEKLTNE